MQKRGNNLIFGIIKTLGIFIGILYSEFRQIYGMGMNLSLIFRSCILLIGIFTFFEGFLQFRIGSKREHPTGLYSRLKNFLVFISIVRLVILCWMFLNVERMYDFMIYWDCLIIPDYTRPRMILIVWILYTLGEIIYRLHNYLPNVAVEPINHPYFPMEEKETPEGRYCPWCGVRHGFSNGRFCSDCGKEL